MLREKFMKKIFRQGGEVDMRKYLTVIVLFVATVLCFTTVSFAVPSGSKTYTISAYVPQQSTGLSVGVSKITPGSPWVTLPAATTALDFGTLVPDNTNKIFRAPYYFAIDVGVVDNTGANWQLLITKTNIGSSTLNLDENLNVTYAKQIDSLTATPIQKGSFVDPAPSITKTLLGDGWLRIYLGVATGKTSLAPGDPADTFIDNTGVKAIGFNKPYGPYNGSITITLSP